MNKNTLITISVLTLVFLLSFMYLSSKNILVRQKGGQFEEDMVQMQSQSSSTEISDIEKDLDATDLSDLDKEITDIENELEQGY